MTEPARSLADGNVPFAGNARMLDCRPTRRRERRDRRRRKRADTRLPTDATARTPGPPTTETRGGIAATSSLDRREGTAGWRGPPGGKELRPPCLAGGGKPNRPVCSTTGRLVLGRSEGM